MDRYEFTLEDVLYRFDDKKEAWLKAQDEADLEGLFAETKQRLRDLYTPVIDRISTVDPGLKSLGQTNLSKIMEQVEFLEKRAKNAIISRNEVALRHMQRIASTLNPLNRPQERVLNIVAYLNKFGDAFIHDLIHMERNHDDLHHIAQLN